jgi:hypothetical protein
MKGAYESSPTACSLPNCAENAAQHTTATTTSSNSKLHGKIDTRTERTFAVVEQLRLEEVQ